MNFLDGIENNPVDIKNENLLFFHGLNYTIGGRKSITLKSVSSFRLLPVLLLFLRSFLLQALRPRFQPAFLQCLSFRKRVFFGLSLSGLWKCLWPLVLLCQAFSKMPCRKLLSIKASLLRGFWPSLPP